MEKRVLFPAPFGPEEPHNLARADLECDPPQHLAVAVAEGEVPGRQAGRDGAAGGRARARRRSPRSPSAHEERREEERQVAEGEEEEVPRPALGGAALPAGPSARSRPGRRRGATAAAA